MIRETWLSGNLLLVPKLQSWRDTSKLLQVATPNFGSRRPLLGLASLYETSVFLS